MPTISTITTFSLPAGQAACFLVGGRGTATVDPTGRGNIYTIGAQESVLGPYAKTVDILVTPESEVSYRIDTDGNMDDQTPPFDRTLMLSGGDGLTVGGQALTAGQAAMLRAGLIGPVFGNTVAIIGDSIAAAGWSMLLATFSGKRMRHIKNAGIGGNTSAAMLARINADVLSLRPAWLIIQGVTRNDPSQGLTVAQTIANVKAMCAASIAAGVSPIVLLGPPNDNASQNAHLRAASLALGQWANENNIPTLDPYPVLADPADGTYLAANTTDGIHVSTAGERLIAEAFLPRIAEIFKPFSLIQTAPGDASNLFTNGLFTADTNADGLADNLLKSGSGATSLVPMSTDGVGNWQVITPGGNETHVYQDVATVIGRTYESSVRIFSTGAGEIRVRGVGDYDMPGTVYKTYGAITAESGAICTGRFVATATTRRIQLSGKGASGTVGFGQVTVRDITALSE